MEIEGDNKKSIGNVERKRDGNRNGEEKVKNKWKQQNMCHGEIRTVRLIRDRNDKKITIDIWGWKCP